MAEQRQELDANEPATPFKLEKARQRGSVVRSVEVNFAVILVACVAYVQGLGPRTLDQASQHLGAALSRASRGGLDLHSTLELLSMDGAAAGLLAAPLLFTIWVSATLTGALQAGGVLTSAPLTPDFSRLNPAAGLAQLFSLRSLNELWRNLLKVCAVCAALAGWYSLHLDAVLALSGRTAAGRVFAGLELVASVLMLLAALAIAFAMLDWGMNRQAYLRRMRMSKREIKDEHKEREGDPRIKARLRELRMQWVQRARQLSGVRSADVVLTNPTHYAVALSYRAGETVAPVIAARGAGELAQRMRWLARLHGVPIVENPALARALFASKEPGSLVPQEHFGEVARVLRWVYTVRPMQQQKGRA